MRGVVWISVGRWPSSAIWMAEVGEVTSRPLEFLRVMSRAWQRRAGASGEEFGFGVVGKAAEIGHGCRCRRFDRGPG